MKVDRQVLQKIRDRTDLVEVIGRYTTLTQRGDRYWGLSPFKSEKTPSFTVKPDDGFYYCFATQKGGDIFRFIQEMEGLTFPEAVSYLADIAGISLEFNPQDDERDRKKNALYDLYERVTKTFRYLLTQDERGAFALQYARERGMSENGMDHYDIGYAVDDGRWLYRFLRSKSYSPDFLADCGLFSSRGDGYSLFRNRLIFPIRNERGRVVAFGGRALSPDVRAKYINSPETPIYNKKSTLYGLYEGMEQIRRQRKVILSEGYFDVIALHESGLSNSVAPLGTAFTEEQGRLLKRWVDDIVLLFDADSAGVEATFRSAIRAEKAGMNCYAVPVPRGKDPADLYVEEGADAVRTIVENAVPVFDYLVQKSSENLDRRDSRSKELLLRKLFPYISIVSSEVRREALLERVGDLLHATVQAVTGDFERWRKGEQPQTIAKPAQRQKHTTTSRDVSLMLATAHDGELFAYLRQRVTAEDFEDVVARKLYYAMEDAFRHDEKLPRGVVDRITDEETRDIVLERLTSGEFSGWTKQDIDRAVGNIRIRKLQEQQRELERSLKSLDGTDPQRIRQVLEQKMAIDQELAKLKVRADDRVAE